MRMSLEGDMDRSVERREENANNGHCASEKWNLTTVFVSSFASSFRPVSSHIVYRHMYFSAGTTFIHGDRFSVPRRQYVACSTWINTVPFRMIRPLN